MGKDVSRETILVPAVGMTAQDMDEAWERMRAGLADGPGDPAVTYESVTAPPPEPQE